MDAAWDAAVRVAEPLARALGPRGLARAAGLAAPVAARLRRRRCAAIRAVIRGWLGLCLDPAAERALVARAVAEECARQAELFRLGALADDLARRPVPVVGLSPRVAGRGLVVATSHAGPHHLAGLALAAQGRRVLELGLAPADVDRVLARSGGPTSALRRHEQRARAGLPVTHLPLGPTAGRGALRRALQALEEGSSVVLPGDGLYARATLTAPWLAGRARLPTGPARLACLAGVPLACAGLRPVGGGWALHVGPCWEPPAGRALHGAAGRAFVAEAVHGYAAWLAAEARAHPAPHLWRWAVIHELQARGRADFFWPGRS